MADPKSFRGARQKSLRTLGEFQLKKY